MLKTENDTKITAAPLNFNPVLNPLWGQPNLKITFKMILKRRKYKCYRFSS